MRPRYLHRCFMLALLAPLAAPTGGCKNKPPPPVALIGGQPVNREEFESELRRVRAETGDLVLQREVMQGLKASVLNQIIERRLVLDEASQYGVTVTDGEVDARIRRIKGDFPEEGFEKTARENFVNLTAWRQRIREGMLMEKVVQEAIGKALDPDEEEMLRYFRAHAGDYSLSDRIHLRQIVVHTREEAEALRARIQGGEPFAEVARKHSLTPDAEQGGDVGVFASGEMPVEFNQAFGLKVNELSPVVQSSYGFHLFLVAEKLAGRIPPFDEVRLKVRDRMMQERKEKAYHAWLKMLRDRAGVRVFQEEIDSIN